MLFRSELVRNNGTAGFQVAAGNINTQDVVSNNARSQGTKCFGSFFSFFFSKAEVPKETYGKEEKNGSLPLRFTVRMSKHRRLRSRKRMQK